MDAAELALAKEALQLMDDALKKLESVTSSSKIQILAKLLHGVIVAAEVLV